MRNKTLITKQADRIKVLERLMCPDGHDFVKTHKRTYGGSGNGDEQFEDIGHCKRCLKDMTV